MNKLCLYLIPVFVAALIPIQPVSADQVSSLTSHVERRLDRHAAAGDLKPRSVDYYKRALKQIKQRESMLRATGKKLDEQEEQRLVSQLQQLDREIKREGTARPIAWTLPRFW